MIKIKKREIGMAKILVSACLLGLPCRYDGNSCKDDRVLALGASHILIPVCPEQLGGLPTPRRPSERIGDGVFMNDGTNVTEQYARGAASALYVAGTLEVKTAILKAKSPSCGKGLIYDGTFTGAKKPGNGVTAELLMQNGIKVYTEEETDIIETQ